MQLCNPLFAQYRQPTITHRLINRHFRSVRFLPPRWEGVHHRASTVEFARYAVPLDDEPKDSSSSTTCCFQVDSHLSVGSNRREAALRKGVNQPSTSKLYYCRSWSCPMDRLLEFPSHRAVLLQVWIGIGSGVCGCAEDSCHVSPDMPGSLSAAARNFIVLHRRGWLEVALVSPPLESLGEAWRERESRV